jgi:hypothetical protein
VAERHRRRAHVKSIFRRLYTLIFYVVEDADVTG